MALNWADLGIAPAQILLPGKDVYLPTWAVVACDQFTSQPDYWQGVSLAVGNNPSTLRMTLPEIYLEDTAHRLPGILNTMEQYVKQQVLYTAVNNGFVLTERTTQAGTRLGLVAVADMEAYDYRAGSQSLIRPTEGTIVSRIPPRIKIREQAALECPHVMLLMDDIMESVVEPIYEQRDDLPMLYDFDLMMGGGHLRGWAVADENLIAQVYGALHAIKARLPKDNPMLFAVGDGNHSLATARAHWENVKQTLQPGETHPARYALVEIENIHDDALTFQPIHRIVTGADGYALMNDWTIYCHQRGMDLSEMPGTNGDHVFHVLYGGMDALAAIAGSVFPAAVGTLQVFLDEWMQAHPGTEIDYIHGEDALRKLCQERSDAVGFLCPGIEKGELLPRVSATGPLPRKTFSMGEANEKRYYMESRCIR